MGQSHVKHTTAADRLRASAGAIQALVAGVDTRLAGWKPSPEAWSMIEVVCHLADEEREDFRTRLDLTLHHPQEDWPPIDPAGWVTRRNYAGREVGASLADFLDERERSLTWLHSLIRPNWASEHSHPLFGSIYAGQLLASWVAHDLLHLRQMVELHYLYHREQAAPYTLDYAGDW